MTTYSPDPNDPSQRGAAVFADALATFIRAATDQGPIAEARADIAAVRGTLEALQEKVERQAAEEREQRQLLGDQIVSLARALDRLVTHLEGLSTLMADMLERLSAPRDGAPSANLAAQASRPASQPSFEPGGEGVTVALAGVPGFQALMDIQKAFTAMSAVSAASVERYQEGDSRILVALRAPVEASELVAAVRNGAGLDVAIEEARPETRRLKLKVSSSQHP